MTSRSQLTGLVAAEGAHPLTLDVLTDAEAREMLGRRLRAERVSAEPDATAELIDLCARLPLALSIAAARASTGPRLCVAALAGELREARGRLDALDTGDEATDVRAVFSWSCRHLSAPAARMFRLLAVHPGPDITVPAAASLAGSRLPQARAALRELTRAHLVAEHAPGRFAFHDLLRAYAAERTRAEDDEAQRQAAAHRMLDHYLHTAHAAALLVHPAREPIRLVPCQSAAVPERLSSYGQALVWFEAEQQVLLAAVDQATGSGLDSHAWQLPWALTDFFDLRGRWHDLSATQRLALAAAQRLGDKSGQAHAHSGIARACIPLGFREDAHSHLRNALDLFGQAR